MPWDQRDNAGLQMPPGSYSFHISYWDDGFSALYGCCPSLVICDSTASATPRNGTGVNPQSLASVSPPVLGGLWDVDLDCTAHAPGPAFLAVFDLPATGSLTAFGEVLVAGNRLLRRTQPHVGSVASFSQDVPARLALCALQAHAQGACFGAPGPRLSNALDLLLGN
jgi:hypothetical protein